MGNNIKGIIPSTHVDIAWKKDADEMSELFEVVILRLTDLLEQNKDLTYILEQAYHFRALAKRRPDLIEKIKKYLAEGRLEVVGGMASTTDTNFPNGENLIRNFLLGKKWFAEHLNAKIKCGWFIDTFGINAQVPQLIKLFGLEYLFANRLGADKINSRFLSRGIDGTMLPVIGKDIHTAKALDDGMYWRFVQEWDSVRDLTKEALESSWDKGFKLFMPYTENE
ncbi:hypothetical protein LJC14_06305, partial [Treponema sp. OttesenSCG-928-L16]|nr:hypothetical protein [Treponema sp. OttesenSCG-928-L16]